MKLSLSFINRLYSSLVSLHSKTVKKLMLMKLPGFVRVVHQVDKPGKRETYLA